MATNAQVAEKDSSLAKLPNEIKLKILSFIPKFSDWYPIQKHLPISLGHLHEPWEEIEILEISELSTPAYSPINFTLPFNYPIQPDIFRFHHDFSVNGCVVTFAGLQAVLEEIFYKATKIKSITIKSQQKTILDTWYNVLRLFLDFEEHQMCPRREEEMGLQATQHYKCFHYENIDINIVVSEVLETAMGLNHQLFFGLCERLFKWIGRAESLKNLRIHFHLPSSKIAHINSWKTRATARLALTEPPQGILGYCMSPAGKIRSRSSLEKYSLMGNIQSAIVNHRLTSVQMTPEYAEVRLLLNHANYWKELHFPTFVDFPLACPLRLDRHFFLEIIRRNRFAPPNLSTLGINIPCIFPNLTALQIDWNELHRTVGPDSPLFWPAFPALKTIRTTLNDNSLIIHNDMGRKFGYVLRGLPLQYQTYNIAVSGPLDREIHLQLLVRTRFPTMDLRCISPPEDILQDLYRNINTLASETAPFLLDYCNTRAIAPDEVNGKEVKALVVFGRHLVWSIHIDLLFPDH